LVSSNLDVFGLLATPNGVLKGSIFEASFYPTAWKTRWFNRSAGHSSLVEAATTGCRGERQTCAANEREADELRSCPPEPIVRLKAEIGYIANSRTPIAPPAKASVAAMDTRYVQSYQP
jgi:hypothetical protein